MDGIDSPAFIFAVCLVILLVVFGIRRWKQITSSEQEKERKRQENHEEKFAREAAIFKREAGLLALVPGAIIDCQRSTYTVSSVMFFSSRGIIDRFRFMLDDGTPTVRWLDLQTRKHGHHVLEIVEQREWIGDLPDFEARESFEYERVRFRRASVYMGSYDSQYNNPIYYNGVVRAIHCWPTDPLDQSLDRRISPVTLKFESFDDGEWTFAVATRIPVLDVIQVIA